VTAVVDTDGRFRHEAVPYPGPDHFVPAASEVVRAGLESNERVLVLASASKLRDLQDSLGSDADEITFLANDEHARNPTRVAMLLDTFRGGADGRVSLGVNDTEPGRSRAVTLETRFADCTLNLAAVRSWAVSLLCLFDLSGLDDDARYSMRRGHGVVRGSDTNSDFEPALAEQLYGTLPDRAPASARRTVIGDGGLPRARAFVREAAAGYGVVPDRVDDLVLAVNEIVTNSLRYGGGTAHLAVWFEDGAVVCEVRDRGFIADPLTGRFAPSASASSGRGVWLAHNLCDLVQLRSSPAGTVVRMFVDR
jgi:anti-sigma regulatory factor (Ser/Thr protein kinase)